MTIKETRLAQKYTRYPTAEQERYQLWVMAKRCCVCGIPAVFHHVTRKGVYGTLQKVGARRSHWWGTQLCDKHHVDYHKHLGSVENFEATFGINLNELAEQNLDEYIEKGLV